MTDETVAPTIEATLFGVPISLLKQGGTVLILLVILYFGSQIYVAKDSAYVALAGSIGTNTTQLNELSSKVSDLEDEVTNMRITIARLTTATGQAAPIDPLPTITPH